MKKQHITSKIMRKTSVQGATLLEVLVSVFLLTFGILGLMATQLRSVSAVSESENQSIAALAAENLAEAMQVNASLDSEGKRNYALYKKTAFQSVQEQKNCEDVDKSKTDSVSGCKLHGEVKKQQLVSAQLSEFEFILKQMPNVVDLKYAICGIGDDPTLTLPKCNSSNQTAIKIVWSTQNKESDENPTSSNAIETHFYQLLLPK